MSKLSSKTKWYVCKEEGRFSVRKTITDSDGKKSQVRLDRDQYRLHEKDRAELQAFVVRLNTKENPGQKVREIQIIENAFISVAILEKFEAHLKESIPSENYVSGMMGRVKNHFLDFFMRTLKLQNPVEWHRVHKDEWARYLNSPEQGLSPKSKLMIVQAANRFIDWLSDQRPDVPKLVFKPISKAKFATLKAEHEADKTVKKPKMIADANWEVIKKNLPEDLAPFAQLAYKYGLRRAELLAIEPEDIKNQYLSIERQLCGITRGDDGKVVDFKTRILKGKSNRKVPHWYCDPGQTYEWVSLAIAHRVMPDTLTEKWSTFIKTLSMDYTLHDFRHTWVTKSLRNQNPRDVQLAAGHKKIETTMQYAHDDRKLADEVFVPKKKVG